MTFFYLENNIKVTISRATLYENIYLKQNLFSSKNLPFFRHYTPLTPKNPPKLGLYTRTQTSL